MIVGKVIIIVGKVIMIVGKVIIIVGKVTMIVGKVIIVVGKVILIVGKVILIVGKVILIVVPLEKHEIDLNGRKTRESQTLHRRNTHVEFYTNNIFGDGPGTNRKASTLASIGLEQVNNSTYVMEFVQNASEISDSVRRLNSWIYLTYQMYKYQDIGFHSTMFVSDMKRHIARATALTSDDPIGGEGKRFVYRKRLSTKEKTSPLHVYKHKKDEGDLFSTPRKMSKYDKKGFRNDISSTPAQDSDSDDRKQTQFSSCDHVTGYYTHRWLQMVVRCPSNWTQESVKLQCETWNVLVLPAFNFLPFLPVQDEQGKVYANVFCAKCHGEDNILPWTTKVVCENYEQHSALSLVNLVSTTYLSQYLRTPHCKREVIPSLPDSIVSCKLYSPVANVRKCTTPTCDVVDSDYPVSFNVLMNFDFTGESHLLFSASPKLSEEYIPRCREWETFDTYSQTCRPITCSKFYTLVGDRCVPTAHDSMPTDTITDLQQLRSVDQTALVSLVLNVTYADYLSFILNNASDVNIVHQLADTLNISAERIKDVNVTFEFGSTNGTALKVTTLTEEEYSQIFPPLTAQPESTTEIPNQKDIDSAIKHKNISRFLAQELSRLNITHHKTPSTSLDYKMFKDKSFWGQKQIRMISGQEFADNSPKRDTDKIFEDTGMSKTSDQSNSSSTEMDIQLDMLRDSFNKRKSFKKYIEELTLSDLWKTDSDNNKGPRKLKEKEEQWRLISDKGLDLILAAKNASTYLYITEPFNNRSDRLVLLAEDIAAAAFMTGFEILEALLKQNINMRVSFVLVPPHDPHSNEDGTNTLLQKINTMIVEKRFSLKLNGNTLDVIDADDKSEVIATTEDFCPWGVENIVYDDEFTMINIDNQTVMYINTTGSYIPVGQFDLWVVFAGSLGANITSVTGMSKYAFVCFMPRILQNDCNRIDLESQEYYVAGNNRSIIFEEREYDFFSYKVVNETTGRVQICVPKSFHSNMQTMLPHIRFYGGCSHDFDTALKVEGYMTLVLGRISIAALAFVLITYGLFRRLRNLPGINTMNLTFALLVAEIIFSEGIDVSTHWLCSAVAMSIHFTFLASHFWMNVISYDVYRTFANSASVAPQLRDKRRYFPRYVAYAWGVPILIVAFCAFIDFSDVFDNVSIGYGKEDYQEANISDYDIVVTQDGDVSIQDLRNATGNLDLNVTSSSFCWITKPLAALITFGAPILLIFLVNCIFFARTIMSITRTVKLTKKSITSKHSSSSFQKMTGRSDVMLYVKMSTVMGFTWIFGLSSSILSSFAKPITYSACIVSHVLAICFTLFNASQGVFIFIAFVCNRRVLALYCGLYRRIKRVVLRKAPDPRLSSVSTIESNRNTPASYSNRI
ncbi:hypothetical protein Btru_042868 [Bulinus truncatus]|nr:hypothetical protein Btru_042868 [Bulinus truncatus]